LGDVVLAASITQALAPVHFLTSPRYADLVARFPGVVQVLVPGDPLPQVDRVIDLQASLKSARLLGRRERVRMQRPLRWARVALKAQTPPTPVIERYAAVAGVPAAKHPWLEIQRTGGKLGVAPAAAHATKRWPHFAALVDRWPGPTVGLGGPQDGDLLRAIGADERIAEAGFDRTLAAMAELDVLVAGDTGLLHLAAACGIPVVGLFGPTHPRDGFWCHPGRPLTLALPCSPCSKHGGPSCPMGDHKCLRALDVDRVLHTAQAAAVRPQT
jgi:ADP-heptose:LPS heptosyltransferase